MKKYLYLIIALAISLFAIFFVDSKKIDVIFTAGVTILAMILAYQQVMLVYVMSNEKYNQLLLKYKSFQSFKEKSRISIKITILYLSLIFFCYLIDFNFLYFSQIKLFVIIFLIFHRIFILLDDCNKLFNIYGTTYSKYAKELKNKL